MRKYFAIPLLLLVVACAQLPGTVAPETANERLVTLEYSYRGALTTVNSLIATGVINPTNVDKVKPLIQQAAAAVDAARVAIKSDAPNATQLTNVANQVVLQLILYLQAQEPKP